MIQGHTTGRLQRLLLGGALAALLAAGAAGAGVAGDPSQWGLRRGTTTEDPMAALNFTEVEYEYTATVGVERAGSRIGTSSGTREST